MLSKRNKNGFLVKQMTTKISIYFAKKTNLKKQIGQPTGLPQIYFWQTRTGLPTVNLKLFLSLWQP